MATSFEQTVVRRKERMATSFEQTVVRRQRDKPGWAAV